jgi:hypothetical protein
VVEKDQDQIGESLREPAPAPSAADGAKSQRGGKRPGAGAPKGNLNALKTGAYSRQFAELGALFAQDPTIRNTLEAMARKHNLKRQRANETAALLLAGIIGQARQISGGRLNLDLPVDDWDSISEAATRAARRQTHTPPPQLPRRKSRGSLNQTPLTNPEKNQTPHTK